MGFPAIILPKIIKIDSRTLYNSALGLADVAAAGPTVQMTNVSGIAPVAPANNPSPNNSTIVVPSTNISTGGSVSSGPVTTGGSTIGTGGGGYSSPSYGGGGGGFSSGPENTEVVPETKNLPIKTNRTRNILLAVGAIGLVALIAFGDKTKKLVKI